MAKRKVSPDKFREVVRARITKGDAFRMEHARYEANQASVKAMLEQLSISDIEAAYPYATYDIKTS